VTINKLAIHCSLGYEAYCGFENEFNLLKQTTLSPEGNVPVDTASYGETVAINHASDYLDDVERAITKIGGRLWLMHAEV